jgi:hypothetical protein
MNTKSIIASISLLFVAGAAMADTTKTREEVAAETRQAIAAGQIDNSEAAQGNVNQYATASTVTREQVKAETLAAAANGTLFHNEAYDSVAYMVPLVKSGNVKAQLAANAAKQNQQ